MAPTRGCPGKMRLARTADWDGAKDFCTNTFSWGDYIGQVWESWVEGGGLIVCEDGGVVLGIAHVAMAGPDAWVEGVRVRPSARRRGVGSALLARAGEMAAASGAAYARAAVESDNAESLALFGAAGYRPVGDWYMYRCRAGPGGCDAAEAAPARVWPKTYVKSWVWTPLDSDVPPERVVWAGEGPVAVLADSERFPGVLMVTLSHRAGRNGGGCVIDYAAAVAHRAGQSVQVFSALPLDHRRLDEEAYRIRMVERRIV